MTEQDNYPYDIGEKVIGKRYPKEVKQGGVIDFVDCGELHSLLADFWNKTRATTREQELIQALSAEQEFREVVRNLDPSIEGYTHWDYVNNGTKQALGIEL